MEAEKKYQHLYKASRKIIFLFAVLFVCVLLIACNHTYLDSNAQSEQVASLQSLVELNMQPEPRVAESNIIALLGEPVSIEEFSFPNQHIRGQLDTIYVYHYEGLQFSVYDLNHTDKAFITEILLSSSSYESAIGLRVGSGQHDVLRLLGPPDQESTNEASYVLTDAGDVLHLSYKNGDIASMHWIFYWD